MTNTLEIKFDLTPGVKSVVAEALAPVEKKIADLEQRIRSMQSEINELRNRPAIAG